VGPLNNELLLEIVSLSAQGMLVVDAESPDLKIVYANPAYEESSGYTAAELADSPWLDYAAADEEAPELVRLKQTVSCSEAGSLSLPFLRKDGDIWLGRLKLTPLACQLDDRRLMLVEHLAEARSSADGAELLKRALGLARRKIASLDRTDPVTGLMSRAQFKIMVRREIAVARREDRSLSLLLFSIPELDAYRQTFGDNAADSSLRMIGAQISGTFRRAGDLSARVDQSTIAVAVLGQNEKQANQLIALVQKKARNLGLHNPRGRLDRYVVVHGVAVSADTRSDNVESLLARGTEALNELNPPASARVAASV
jgi:diguanylate cyclase (GGDEF)-like protein/PAS domain S-box-containing protein